MRLFNWRRFFLRNHLFRLNHGSGAEINHKTITSEAYQADKHQNNHFP